MHPVSLIIALGILWVQQQVTCQIPTRPTLVVTSCGSHYSLNSGNYTQNSTYHKNLKRVFSDLVSNASEALFYSASAGATNTTYGQYYCRGDISGRLCRACVEAATGLASEGGVCFPLRAGSVEYEECTLLYDYKSNVGIWDSTWSPGWWSSRDNVSDPATFNQILIAEMKTLIQTAAYGGDPLEFATGEQVVTPFETVYCLVQCSPDVVDSDCEGCLNAGLRFMIGVMYGRQWGMALYFQCQIRYSLSLFYSNTSSVVPPPPSAAAPPPPPPFVALPPPNSGKDAKGILITDLGKTWMYAAFVWYFLAPLVLFV